MKFTMPQNKTVATKLGHTIEFKAGVPTHVPKECYRAVQAEGAVPEDKIVDAAVPSKKVVEDAQDRRIAVFKAFEQLVEKNKRGDFSANGMPKTQAIEKLTDFDIDAKERDALWRDFLQSTAGT